MTLLGALASVRQGEVWRARERVRAVVPLAERTGEGNVYWTAFGPTNVAMYAVSVEIEAGEAAEALRLAEQVDHDRSPSIERRVAFLIEQAKGYTQYEHIPEFSLSRQQTSGSTRLPWPERASDELSRSV